MASIESGERNSILRGYRHRVEARLFDAVLATLAEVVGKERPFDMVDCAIVQACRCAIAKKRGSGN